MLSEFSSEQWELQWQPDLGKINQNCITITLLMIKNSKINVKISQFTTQCKGDISHAFQTAKNHCVWPMMCKRPDVPLQDELMCWFCIIHVIFTTWINIPIRASIESWVFLSWMVNVSSSSGKGTSGLLHIVWSNTVSLIFCCSKGVTKRDLCHLYTVLSTERFFYIDHLPIYYRITQTKCNCPIPIKLCCPQ